MLVRAGSTDSEQNEEALGHQNRMRGRAAGAAAGAAGAPADAQRIAVGGGCLDQGNQAALPPGREPLAWGTFQEGGEKRK